MKQCVGRNKYNILFFESGTGYGGSSVCLFNMLKKLDRSTFQAHVACVQDGPNIQKIRDLGIDVHIFKSFKIFKLIKLIKSLKISLIHCNNELYSNISAIIAARITGRICFCHMRGVRALTRRERVAAQWVDQFIAVSEYCKIKLVKEGLPSGKIEVVYDGIDAEGLNNIEEGDGLKEALGLDGQVKLIGTLGRLVKGKGFEYFIQAAERVIRDRKDVRFVIIGEGSQKDELRNLIDSLSLSEFVLMAAWQSDVGKVMRSLDIVVNPSCLDESFGMVNVEAMAYAKPVVATLSGAYPEIVTSECGLLVNARSSKDIAAGLNKLMENESLADQMGRQGRARVEKHFNIANNIKQIEKLYEKAFKKRTG